MNLLELCLSPDFGGLEIFFRDYARWLATRQDVRLHLCVQTGSRLSQELKPLDLPTLEFKTTSGAIPYSMATTLARFLRDHQVDVLHLHWKDDLPLVALAAQLARRRVKIVHSRHMDLPGPKKDPYHRFLYASIDLYHTITKALAEQAAERLPIAREKIRHIYLGASAAPVTSAESRRALRSKLGLGEGFTVGVVGRISRYKGQHLLIDAILQLRDRGIEVQGLIMGYAMEDDYLLGLKLRAQEAGLADDVVFLGFQEEPHAVIQALDAVALTTVKETFGLVLVEAMLLGVPVIGSDAGVVPEISGLLFESGNSASLAAAIEALCKNPYHRERLASAGQARARAEFDRDTQYEKLLALINSTAA